MKIIVATMVKDEDDIIKEWLDYYGKIFGFNNIIIVDNYSTDNTYKICLEYIPKGIRLIRRKSYLNKGKIMTNIKNSFKCNFFIPVDIDEFIVNYNKKTNKINFNVINQLTNIDKKYTNNLVFKMNYINPIKTNDNKINILKNFKYGHINNNYGKFAKSFIKNDISNNIIIDHGNHLSNYDYIVSQLYLVHYHKRSCHQFKKKVINNIKGLNYKLDICFLKKKIEVNSSCIGNHHIKNYLNLNNMKCNIKKIRNSEKYIKLDKLINFAYK